MGPEENILTHMKIGVVFVLLGCFLIACGGDGSILHEGPFAPGGTPTVVSVSPDDGATHISIDTPIAIVFSTAMDPATVTVQAKDGACSGSVQFSRDGFVSCAGGAMNTSDNTTFTITPAATLCNCNSYRVRVTVEAAAAEGTALAAPYTQADGFATADEPRWTEYPGNPIIAGGRTDGVDRAYYPSVLKVGDTYHLWYGDGLTTRHAASAYANFSDISFPAPLISGLDAGYQPYHPNVLYDAAGWNIGDSFYPGPFLMYYTDSNAWTNPPRVAHSADGISWRDISACSGVSGYDTTGDLTVYGFSVLHEGSNTWKGYGDNNHGHIQFYTSADGLNWTGQAADILNFNGQYNEISASIMKIDTTYILFYSSGATNNNLGIYVATSTDGANFTPYSGNPIFSVNDGQAWRANRSYTSSVVKETGSLYLLYFSGRSAGGNYSIGYAQKCDAPY